MICLTRYYLGVHIGVVDEWGVWGVWYVRGRREIHTGLWKQTTWKEYMGG